MVFEGNGYVLLRLFMEKAPLARKTPIEITLKQKQMVDENIRLLRRASAMISTI